MFKQNNDTTLWLVGQFSPELINYNFDFFNNENISYLGVIDDRKRLADVMRQCKYLYFPAFADASPNTLAEAMACGCKPLLLNIVGGSIEVMKKNENKSYTIQEMADEYINIFKKLLC